jgi:predicted transcriptional regulator
MSRRKQQVMEIIYRKGSASAGEVQKALPDPPSYSAVRSILRLLVEEGRLKHKREGRKYIYAPTIPAVRARRSALRNVLTTFFDDSLEHAVASLLDLKAQRPSEAELDRVSRMIEEAKQKGKRS